MPANWLVLLFIGSSRSRLVTRGRNSLRSRWRLCRLTDAASPLRVLRPSILKSPDIHKKTPANRLVFLFVLSAKYRCQTRPGPRTAGRRFCAVQAFCRRQHLGVGAIHLPRAFEISQDSIKITTPNGVVIFMEVTPGFEPGNQGFADPCLTTWLCHRRYIYIICRPFEKVHTFFK